MKILHVHPTFTSVKGGVERHIDGLSKYLARKGHEVDIGVGIISNVEATLK